jgi:hypothetical protein
MFELNWVKVLIDAPYFVAGERISGEVLVKTNQGSCELVFKSFGTEKVSVDNNRRDPITHTNTILTIEERFGVLNQRSQVVYPFDFKLPLFSPASLDYEDSDIDGNHVKAQISYVIEASLLWENKEISKDSIFFTVFNKNSRLLVSQSLDFTTELSACFCFSRGVSKIKIEPMESTHFACNDSKRYKVLIDCPANQNISSFIGQIVHNITVYLPSQKPLNIRKIVSRCVSTYESLIKANDDVNTITYFIDANLSEHKNGENPSSNHSTLVQSEYNLELFGIYDVGCRSKLVQCTAPIHVNPASRKKETFELPQDWHPREFSLKNMIPNINHSLLRGVQDYE